MAYRRTSYLPHGIGARQQIGSATHTDDCRLWPMKPWPVRVRFGAYVDGPGTLLHIDGMRGSRGDDLSV